MGSAIQKWCILVIAISVNYDANSKPSKPKTQSSTQIIQNIAKNPSFRYYSYTFRMPHLPDKHRILAGPIRNTSITYFWYDFYSPILRQPNNYVMCKYNHTNSSMTLIPPPCGSVPSMHCLSDMINISLHNDTGEESCKLNTTFNPMLYNIPRWTTTLYIGANRIFIDSQTIYFLGLSEVIFKNLLRHNCTKSFYLTNAISRHVFRVPRVSLWKLKQTMRRLKRRQKIEKDTQKKRSRRSTNITTTIIPTILTTNTTDDKNKTVLPTNSSETFYFKSPVIITQLQTMVTWLYTSLRYKQKEFCKDSKNRTRQSAWANHTRQILYNDTAWSIHGNINLTDLYVTIPPYTNNTIMNSLFIDPLWDYIVSLDFIEKIQQNKKINLYQRPTNVSLSILPP
ncbi:envelope glycoprotein O [Cercopithecine betaherpesvirus 5]|uniref:Envelope glycoprotein O n=1 Tax=Simian cytomegalovirus (strain Colburn) TaxID=50292 RepID=G8XTW9_SCMVC|nr:envelope glycoprotein O [Cercopithecine betaherpesvirus 5]